MVADYYMRRAILMASKKVHPESRRLAYLLRCAAFFVIDAYLSTPHSSKFARLVSEDFFFAINYYNLAFLDSEYNAN